MSNLLRMALVFAVVPWVDAFSCGVSHTCALHADGSVSCWGVAAYFTHTRRARAQNAVVPT